MTVRPGESRHSFSVTSRLDQGVKVKIKVSGLRGQGQTLWRPRPRFFVHEVEDSPRVLKGVEEENNSWLRQAARGGLALPLGQAGYYTCPALRPYQFSPVHSLDVTEGHSNRLWSRKFTSQLALVTCSMVVLTTWTALRWLLSVRL